MSERRVGLPDLDHGPRGVGRRSSAQAPQRAMRCSLAEGRAVTLDPDSKSMETFSTRLARARVRYSEDRRAAHRLRPARCDSVTQTNEESRACLIRL